MSAQYKGLVAANDFLSLPKYTAYVRLMINGSTSEPFSIQTVPLDGTLNSLEEREKIRQQSRQRYTLPKLEVEQLLQARDKKDAEKPVITNVVTASQTVDTKTNNTDDEQKTVVTKTIETTADTLELGKSYLGKVKFKYNYGIFVTYGAYEGLLHKNDIKEPAEGIHRKKYYHEDDEIKVIAKEFKKINGEEKVVWGQ